MTILVTGHAGFIGFHTTIKLLELGYEVVGVDVLNDYYDVELKKNRIIHLTNLANKNSYKFENLKINISEYSALKECFQKYNFKKIVNLAAQAGVRYSIENPQSYIDTNITGFLNILELSKEYGVEDIVYASTSSIYGANSKIPSSEDDNTDQPIQFYAVTKKTNELMAHAYADLHKMRSTGLRFFTVYGPWGRPDMALFLFTDAIINKKPINLFNNGNHFRDFTYIDDIVEGVIKTLDNNATSNINWKSIQPDPANSIAPWCIYNIGNNKPVKLMDYIDALEKALGKKAKLNFLPLQPGDVPDTYANVDNLKEKFNYKPSTTVIEGVSNFVKWYKDYYQND